MEYVGLNGIEGCADQNGDGDEVVYGDQRIGVGGDNGNAGYGYDDDVCLDWLSC